jgi:hypothetical protein
MKVNQPININYCASVVEITKLVPIEKADKIQVAIISGNSVVVSMDAEAGIKGLFFNLECQLENNFLSKHNLFRDSTKNINPEKVGFFEANGRIRAVNLRGQKSEGFFIPFSGLHEDYAGIAKLEVGADFDHIGSECICRKYAVKQDKQQNTQKQGKKVNQFSRLVDNQFNLHIDTVQAKKNFHLINPNDIISITDKWHGTSAVFSNVLTNRKLKWYEKLLLKAGVKVDVVEYGNVYSSRKVVKNKYINEGVTAGFYGSDVWSLVNDDLKGIIPKGISLYGEIVGYVPGSDGKHIQGGYNYGCQPNTCRFMVYRITNTNVDGVVTEQSWGQIKDFCGKYGLDHVHEFYYGYAKDLYKYVPLDDEWNETVLSLLMDDFNIEKECKYNKGMPAEGIVIRQDKSFDCNPMKLKSFGFLKHETILLDSGVSDIESDQEIDVS